MAIDFISEQDLEVSCEVIKRKQPDREKAWVENGLMDVNVTALFIFIVGDLSPTSFQAVSSQMKFIWKTF